MSFLVLSLGDAMESVSTSRGPLIISEESPEDLSCCLSRLLFCWALPVFWRGYRRGRTDLEDLPPVPQRDSSWETPERFLKYH